MDLNPLKDGEWDHQQSSVESSESLNPERIPDAKAQLSEYQKQYLEDLKNLEEVSNPQIEDDIEELVKGSDPVCCKSCRLFGCLDSPPTKSLSIPGPSKRHRSLSIVSSQEEVLPAHDPEGKNELFYMNLEKVLGDRLSIHKRQRLDSLKIDGFNFIHKANAALTPFPSPNIKPSSDNLFIAERELEKVEGWNRIFNHQENLEIDISDYENSWIEDFSLQETADIVGRTIEGDLKPGQDLELSMVDIEHAIRKGSIKLCLNACDADYGPLPTYYFTLNHKKLKTILDTGAAMNYIARNKVKELIRLKNSCIKVYNVDSQGVRLANGEKEETSEMASFTIYHGSCNFKVSAFILNLPTIDLILGLPWYKANKPVINFETGSYTVNHQSGEVHWKTMITPEADDQSYPLCTADKEERGSFEEEVENVA